MAFKTPYQIKKENLIWIGLILIFAGLTVITSINEPGNQFATTYQTIWIMTLFGFALSILLPGVSEFIGINKSNFVPALLVGAFVGFLLISGLWIGGDTSQFSLIVPFSASSSPLGGLGFEALGAIFIIGIFVAELEEALFSSWFRPTAEEWLTKLQSRTLFIYAIGMFLMYLYSPLRIIAWPILAIATLDYFVFKGKMLSFLNNRTFAFYGSLILKGIFFAIVHYYAAISTGQDPTGYMIAAFIFAIVGGLMNNAFKSTLSSRIAHSINNTSIMVTYAGLPIILVVPIVASYALLLAFASGAKLSLKGITSGKSFGVGGS